MAADKKESLKTLGDAPGVPRFLLKVVRQWCVRTARYSCASHSDCTKVFERVHVLGRKTTNLADCASAVRGQTAMLPKHGSDHEQ